MIILLRFVNGCDRLDYYSLEENKKQIDVIDYLHGSTLKIAVLYCNALLKIPILHNVSLTYEYICHERFEGETTVVKKKIQTEKTVFRKDRTWP